ncbi:MAG: OsmC family protein [Trueperaceae bacterium]|nr:OsmC family protein [Trueperaceae bacterium]
MATTKSHAVWEGSLKEGKGSMTLPKGNFTGPFTRASRFENGEGTNPEELIGAAHAGCYSMFLSALLSNNNTPPEKVETTATVTIGDGPTITKIELVTKAKVSGITEAEFKDFAQKAKEGCPVSKALASVNEITLDASLES